jgi:hypothetical protein
MKSNIKEVKTPQSIENRYEVQSQSSVFYIDVLNRNGDLLVLECEPDINAVSDSMIAVNTLRNLREPPMPKPTDNEQQSSVKMNQTAAYMLKMREAIDGIFGSGTAQKLKDHKAYNRNDIEAIVHAYMDGIKAFYDGETDLDELAKAEIAEIEGE